ncbi:MAG: zinc-dependent alcohol dehydrogenase family protein [Firmicutes bacterium]|nr:zinc-dependent alcohol dehydrogenase family protein [Bacillota bacterium]
MRAMVVAAPGRPLEGRDLPTPEPGPGEVRVRVRACGVCRTDLHIADGELMPPALPRVPGHEVVGTVEAVGEGVEGLAPGTRVGVPWLAHACGHCRFCRRGQENLCLEARFTGFHVDGGYAERLVAEARFVFPLPPSVGDDVHAAPLMCAGLIGFRALRLAGDGERVGLYGFGAAAHILAQVLAAQGREVYAFTRPGDRSGQAFARSLGARWAGGSDEAPPEPLDAAIVFAPVGELVPLALRAVDRGGRVVLGGIHMSDLPPIPYRILWEERSIASVANLTRADGEEFLALAARTPIRTEVTPYPLEAADEALAAVRAGRLHGAAVLVPDRTV